MFVPIHLQSLPIIEMNKNAFLKIFRNCFASHYYIKYIYKKSIVYDKHAVTAVISILSVHKWMSSILIIFSQSHIASIHFLQWFHLLNIIWLLEKFFRCNSWNLDFNILRETESHLIMISTVYQIVRRKTFEITNSFYSFMIRSTTT